MLLQISWYLRLRMPQAWVRLLREICNFLGVVWVARQNFFFLIRVSDLEFADRTSPAIYLGKFLTRDMGAQSWLGRWFWSKKWRLFACCLSRNYHHFSTITQTGRYDGVYYDVKNGDIPGGSWMGTFFCKTTIEDGFLKRLLEFSFLRICRLILMWRQCL